MDATDFLILTYLALGGPIKGKTILQKRVYFISVLINRSKELGYKPHYYGPYSSVIAVANSELRALGYISESETDIGIYNYRGFEIKRYDYELTVGSKNLAEAIKDKNADLWKEIEKATQKVIKAGNLNYLESSVAAKVHFILSERKNGSVGTKEIQKLASSLGWDVNDTEIKKASAFLKKLGLINLTD